MKSDLDNRRGIYDLYKLKFGFNSEEIKNFK